MKRLTVVMLVCALVSAASAALTPDINYSTDDGGKWHYDGVDTLSIIGSIGIDDIQGSLSDTLVNQSIHIPGFKFSNLSNPYPGLVNAAATPGKPIMIKDANGNMLLRGKLQTGDFFAFNTVSGAYTEFKADITVDFVDNAIGSALLSSISVGSMLDFNITLQHNSDFADIISQGLDTTGTLSGSMTLIPEPATLAILAFGSLLARRKRR